MGAGIFAAIFFTCLILYLGFFLEVVRRGLNKTLREFYCPK